MITSACEPIIASRAVVGEVHLAHISGNGDGAGSDGPFFPYEALVEGREWPAAVDASHRERCVCQSARGPKARSRFKS